MQGMRFLDGSYLKDSKAIESDKKMEEPLNVLFHFCRDCEFVLVGILSKCG